MKKNRQNYVIDPNKMDPKNPKKWIKKMPPK